MLVTAPSLGLEPCDGIAIGRERMTAITRRMGIEAAWRCRRSSHRILQCATFSIAPDGGSRVAGLASRLCLIKHCDHVVSSHWRLSSKGPLNTLGVRAPV